jgi:hypothetical protein
MSAYRNTTISKGMIHEGSFYFFLPHLPQKSDMRSDRITDPGIFDIDQPIFLAGLPDDLADGRIVNVRYFGEKMMLDLEIQPADQPG